MNTTEGFALSTISDVESVDGTGVLVGGTAVFVEVGAGVWVVGGVGVTGVSVGVGVGGVAVGEGVGIAITTRVGLGGGLFESVRPSIANASNNAVSSVRAPTAPIPMSAVLLRKANMAVPVLFEMELVGPSRRPSGSSEFERWWLDCGTSTHAHLTDGTAATPSTTVSV